jgi:hypothetical protein
MPPRSHPLLLPRPGIPQLESRRLRRRRRPLARWRQAGLGLLLILCASGILTLLMQLPQRLDTLLLVSNAIVNLIRGLMQLALALLQLGVVLAVVLLALFAVLLLIGGGMRLLRAVLPGSRGGPATD